MEKYELKKLNPRGGPEDTALPSRLQSFLSKAKQKPLKKSEIPVKKEIFTKKSLPERHSHTHTSLSLYKQQLEYSRNYSKYIQDLEKGAVREDLFPENTSKSQDLDLIPMKDKKPSADGKALFQYLTKPKPIQTDKKIKLKGKGLLQKSLVWCARCSKKHDPDLHFQSKPAEKKKNFQLPYKREHKEVEESYSDDIEADEYDEDDDFIEKDDDEEMVKRMVRKVTGFDPTKYRNIDRLPTYGMESNADRVLYEERHTSKIGRLEDQRELEKIRIKRE